MRPQSQLPGSGVTLTALSKTGSGLRSLWVGVSRGPHPLQALQEVLPLAPIYFSISTGQRVDIGPGAGKERGCDLPEGLQICAHPRQGTGLEEG